MSIVDLDLIRKYDISGPRYTSYPTALQFDTFSADDYHAAIAASPAKSRPLSLYFHLPFCSTLCYYCGCAKIVTRDRSKGERYLSYLKKEITIRAADFKGRVVSQLHWGGGTPTFLDDGQVRDLMDFIGDHFAFETDDAREFSIEVDPRTVDAGRIFSLRASGFNRLSLGIQDFAKPVQKAVNRIQDYDATRTVIEAARSAGFKSISVDLIYGLPHQSLASFTRTLQQVIHLDPDRISIYNYAHLPDRFPAQKRINVVDLPVADQKLRIFKQCIDVLTAAGYRYIGMDHFAKPGDELAIAQAEGTLQRNFQGYSTFAECDMVAMGITAISQIGNTYSQNAKTLEAWEAALDRDALPIERGIVIDADDLVRKAVIMSLICHLALSFEEVTEQFGVDFPVYFADELHRLKSFERDGLVRFTAKNLVVTDKGRLLIRNICMIFDRHLRVTPTTRYSKAI